jgi:hypothetical protein
MVDTFRRIGRVRAPSTSAGGNGVAAVPPRREQTPEQRQRAVLPLAGAESPTIAYRRWAPR